MIKSYLLLIASIVINFSGQIIFTEIANKISFLTFNFESIKTIFLYLVYEPNFWLALFIFFIAALFWIVGLKKVALVKAFSIKKDVNLDEINILKKRIQNIYFYQL